MSEIALEIDANERRLMMESGMESSDYLSFLAQDSSNVDPSGNFSIQVLEESLKRFDLSMMNLTSPNASNILHREGGEGEGEGGLQHEEGFICNLQSHWIALRKLNGYFFNLNSLQSSNEGWGPEYVSNFYLETYLHELLQKRYNIFVVRGTFPQTDTNVEVRERTSGRWFDAKQVIDYTRNPHKRPKTNQPPALSSLSAYGDDADLARALAASVQSPKSGGSEVWNGPTYQIDQTDSATSPDQTNQPMNFDEDEDLRRALAMSMEDATKPSYSAAASFGAAGSGTNSSIAPPAATVTAVSSSSSSSSSIAASSPPPSSEMVDAAMAVISVIAASAAAAKAAMVEQTPTHTDASSGVHAATTISTQNDATMEEEEEDEDEALRRAIAMSMQQ